MVVAWIVISVVVALGVVTAVVVRTRHRPPSFEATESPEHPFEVEPSRPVEAAAPAGAVVEVRPAGWHDGLGKTRGAFSSLRALRRQTDLDTTGLGELRETLLGADVGVETTDLVLATLRERLGRRASGPGLLDALRAELLELLGQGDRTLHLLTEPGVTNVWLFVGVNGVGKTTTIGKVARQQMAAGRSVLLAAGDTFRAAAGEQLRLWAERSGADIVSGAEGGDPSAVVFDAIQRAAARGNDLVLADTAGRFHNRVNLVEELKKIRRIADRPPGAVSEVLLVLDATTGQNGVVQAREFAAAVGVTGIVLTKLDGTAKGGVVLAVQRVLGLPVKLVGVGEGPEDLLAFEPDAFVDALLGA
ncbi:MAG TPA: signal recognition particle-docking protein FtsY [Acidimicrobiales bacterium]|nr:signal recognition particle-docking protein FtsY [Acidimicrobiales bacterium]